MNTHKLLQRQVTSEIKKRRLIFLTIMCLSLMYLLINFVFGNTGLIRYTELQDKKRQIETEIRNIETHNNLLRSELKLFKENPFYMEKHARENFNMARPDEYVFKYDQ
ncbi:MAG: septum formation initiator family protein [Nitrospirota bacterium]